ncbi:hypothetical protein J4434_07270 [Candidatus Woesearchaeota archaeon]|nr:hypothetical protein [Candidatus Woesearchaeota archaeon]
MIKLQLSKKLVDMKSTKRLIDIWPEIVATILSTTRTLVGSKNSFYTKLTYLKNFSNYTLEVNVVKYESKLYITGVSKNEQIKLSSMFK